MKSILKILVIALAMGALAQTVVQAKGNGGNTSDTVSEKSNPGI